MGYWVSPVDAVHEIIWPTLHQRLHLANANAAGVAPISGRDPYLLWRISTPQSHTQLLKARMVMTGGNVCNGSGILFFFFRIEKRRRAERRVGALIRKHH